MEENNNTSGNLGKKAAQTGKNAVKFGVAAAKVFSGTATPNDWKIFLKYAIPVALGSLAVTLLGFLLMVAVIWGPVLTVVDYVKSGAQSFGQWVSNIAEKTDNLIKGNGWYDDETAFQEALKKKYKYYKSKGAPIQTSYVMAVLNMKYIMIDKQVNLGEDIDEAEYDYIDENEVEAGEENPNIMPFGQMIPDMKRLVEHMVHKRFSIPQINSDSPLIVYNPSMKALKGFLGFIQSIFNLVPDNIRVSNQNYLSYLRFGTWADGDTHSNKMEYIELTEEEIRSKASDYKKGYIYRAFKKEFESIEDDYERAVKIERLIEDIYEYAKTISDFTDEEENSMQVCKGNYTSSGTVDIDIKDLSNVYVNVADESCPQGTLESCNNWVATNVPFKDYIMSVVSAENNTTNIEALKSQFVASKSYTIGRIRSMGRTWHEVDGKYVIYMLGSTSDQVYKDISTLDENTKTRLSDAYDATVNDFIVDDSNNIAVASYCADFGICNFCVKGNGTCFAQQTANRTTNQTYKEILGYHYSAYNLYDMSNKSIQVSSVSCVSVAGSGQVRLPIDEGLYTITSKFGARNDCGGVCSTNHKGWDFGAAQGTPIYSIAPGVVISVQKQTTGYGKHIIMGHDIDSDGNYDYYIVYAHNSELLVKEGDHVPGGSMIAKVGSTGNSTGPHLHFEIRKDANDSAHAVDPEEYINDIKSGNSVFNQMIKVEKKYYNQGDYSDVEYCYGNTVGDNKATIANSGCLPTSIAMVVAATRDSLVTPTTVASNICTNYKDYRIQGAGTDSGILTNNNFLSGYGLTSTHVKDDYDNKIIEALNAGKIIIANVQGGEFNPSNGGHYIVLTEMIGEEVSVYDPGNRLNTKSFPMETVTKNISNGIWIFE